MSTEPNVIIAVNANDVEAPGPAGQVARADFDLGAGEELVRVG